MKKALLVGYGGGHITMIEPVARQLESRGVGCVVMALTTGFLKARQLGLHPLGYRDFAHLVDAPEQVLDWGRKLAGENTHPNVSLEESQWYLGVNYAQWVRDLGEEAAARQYRKLGRRGFHPLDFMTAVVREVRPDVVVTTNSPRTEAAAVEAARRLGIPTLSMTDLPLDASDPYCRRAVHADRITVLSDRVKQALTTAGIPAHRLAVTGNPAFDTLCSPDIRRQADELRARLGWASKRVILFAGHAEESRAAPPVWQAQGFGSVLQRWLAQWVYDHPGEAAMVRYHPSESHLYPAMPASERLYRSEPSHEALHPVLLASDIVLVQTSTVGLEAALAGRRVLCLKFAPSVREASYNFADMGLAEGITSMQDLGRALSESGSGFRVNSADFHVGAAAAKVTDEILALLAP
ncbi:UDP-glycosyltransferase [Ramlibacter tataouinensis]|uniref:UDP-glycosyltransferase n=1 Tax=Ramlibacter tataouinensis TaxID=94132 RepID=UPI0022F3B18D|nr:UDP-glycosyltransferase [Ramlibacter tataouinensis]WBY00899.1 UDP-glycosyltransferase [Ramlibacter tataouinensis]